MNDHHHHHHHHASGTGRTLIWALLLTLGFALVEAVSGWWSGSLALLGDAGHMLTDGLSLGLAAFAGWLAQRPVSRLHSYGLGRAELLTALFNGVFMLAIVVGVAVAAIDRLLDPRPVHGEMVIGVALIGLLINLLVAWLLSRDSHNLNVRAALLHVMGDLLGSVAALIAGVAITYTGWTPIDPLLSLLIAALILVSALRLLRETLHLLLDGVPPTLQLQQVSAALLAIDGIRGVHDLHIWQLSGERVALTAHLDIDNMEQWPLLLNQAQQRLEQAFKLDHITLQPEVAGLPDRLYQIEEPSDG